MSKGASIMVCSEFLEHIRRGTEEFRCGEKAKEAYRVMSHYVLGSASAHQAAEPVQARIKASSW